MTHKFKLGGGAIIGEIKLFSSCIRKKVPSECRKIIMKVKEYTFMFTELSKYAWTMVDVFRVRVSKFVYGII